MPWLQKNRNTLTALDGTSMHPAGLEVDLKRDILADNRGQKAYSIKGWNAVRVLIYKEVVPMRLQHKLARMVQHRIDLRAQPHFAWFIDIVVNDYGLVVGYIVNVIDSAKSLSSWNFQNSELSYDKKICIAKNLCIALEMFHQQGLCFCNLNTGSVLVNIESCHVFLKTSTDAKFIRDEHSENVNSLDSDLLSLGTIIFSLLHNGKQPLSTIYNEKWSNTREIKFISGLRRNIRIFHIPYYRYFWRRFGGAGNIYDRCFAPNSSVFPLPSATEWYQMLDRKAAGAQARISRFAESCVATIRAIRRALHRATRDVETEPDQRNEIASALFTNLSVSENMSVPRVFHRTTCLFSFGFCLCVISYALAYKTVYLTAQTLFVATVLSALFLSFGMGKLRGNVGYKPHHYALFVILLPILTVLIAALIGGAF